MIFPADSVRAANRNKWRAWLEKNHSKATEVWLVFVKKGMGEPTVTYDEAVEEALCFGWIDGLVKRIDDKYYMRRFTPRKSTSNWAESNRKRFARLIAEGRMTDAGMARLPESLSRYVPSYERSVHPPDYLREALQENEPAWTHFQELAPSHRKKYIAWIDSAKREETREKRMAEAFQMLKEKKVLGINVPRVTPKK